MPGPELMRSGPGSRVSAGVGGAGGIDQYEFVVQPRLAGVCRHCSRAIEACRLEAYEPAGVRLGEWWRCGTSSGYLEHLPELTLAGIRPWPVRRLADRGPVAESNHHLGFRALLRRSSQIASYRRISARIPDRGRLPPRYKTPASSHIHRPLVSKTGVIAMQKVEGSNPFSRFASILPQTTASAFAGKSNHRRRACLIWPASVPASQISQPCCCATRQRWQSHVRRTASGEAGRRARRESR